MSFLREGVYMCMHAHSYVIISTLLRCMPAHTCLPVPSVLLFFALCPCLYRHQYTNPHIYFAVKSLEQEVQRLQRRASSRSLLQLRRQSSSSEQDSKAPAKVRV